MAKRTIFNVIKRNCVYGILQNEKSLLKIIALKLQENRLQENGSDTVINKQIRF